MKKTTKRILAGIAALASIPAVGLATATNASAAAGTRDNHVYNIDGRWFPNGYVMWNDYKDSNHSYDLDDLWLTDRGDDGKSVSLTVYRNGKFYKHAHAYNHETKKVYLWNLKKGEKVFWTACVWNNGVKGPCENHWTQE